MPLGPDKLKKISKSIALILRHRPDSVGVELQEGGWVEVDKLLAGMRAAGKGISRGELDQVVRENDKRRFALDETGTRIRASQGHSVEVDLGLKPVVPPDVLYHGTHAGAVDVVLGEGLEKMRRHAVHLSADAETATRVGSRRGAPVVLRVDAKGMAGAGFTFYRSDNGVWLTEFVPPEYLGVGS